MQCNYCGTEIDNNKYCPGCGKPNPQDTKQGYQKGDTQQSYQQPNYQNYPVQKRLTKGNDKMIGGVCSGFAEYAGMDTTIVRILLVLLTLAGGSGIILYFIAYFVMPENPSQYQR